MAQLVGHAVKSARASQSSLSRELKSSHASSHLMTMTTKRCVACPSPCRRLVPRTRRCAAWSYQPSTPRAGLHSSSPADSLESVQPRSRRSPCKRKVLVQTTTIGQATSVPWSSRSPSIITTGAVAAVTSSPESTNPKACLDPNGRVS